MAFFRVLGFLALLSLLHAPTSEAQTGGNPVVFLTTGGNFTTLLSLLQANNLTTPFIQLLRTSGVTLFAPTDKAFNSLPRGTLRKLTAQQQKTILLLHVLPKYYTLPRLLSARAPIQTAAPGLKLTFSVRGSVPYVSSGVVTTPIRSSLYPTFPLSMFPIDAVLLPRL